MQIEAMRDAAERASALLKPLANADRLLLLCQMVEQERCVSELEQLTGIRQPTLSQQLGVLRNEGLVDTRREGKHVYYSLASAQAQAVLSLLYHLYCSDEGVDRDVELA
ncbi:metalloregulator ArsR/SmtB family transcription factor [Chitiniphilus purpureus]|uniref:Metalloregulator ArsR/SmtB family transcription factor n=1 Tax=Chitiniphilus purpureus TaxID=2981137 RepID=A0ABY6DJM5_9NEIS|nr:metalloregulator ArsR/SmtB family transcription factor [Chitiniphilus sp. CD1]UXY14433.1 metalloregulator ArsR/SmtB family transcription factor [Chitiniphilus sp. CD1]